MQKKFFSRHWRSAYFSFLLKTLISVVQFTKKFRSDLNQKCGALVKMDIKGATNTARICTVQYVGFENVQYKDWILSQKRSARMPTIHPSVET